MSSALTQTPKFSTIIYIAYASKRNHYVIGVINKCMQLLSQKSSELNFERSYTYMTTNAALDGWIVLRNH